MHLQILLFFLRKIKIYTYIQSLNAKKLNVCDSSWTFKKRFLTSSGVKIAPPLMKLLYKQHDSSKSVRADLSLCSDLVHGLLSWFSSDQLQQTVLIQDLGAQTLRLSIKYKQTYCISDR